MVSISSKKRAAGKLSKRCLSLDQKIEILDEVKIKKRWAAEKLQKNSKSAKHKQQMLSSMKLAVRAEY